MYLRVQGGAAVEAQAKQLEHAQRLAWFRSEAERMQALEASDRERLRPAEARKHRPAHALDPGPVPRAHEREGARARELAAAIGGTAAQTHTSERKDRIARKRRARAWKRARRKVGSEVSALIETLGRDRTWTIERRQRLAVRIKKNDAIIAHPARAAAELAKLPPWSRAAVLRVLRAECWTVADECARRHVALWCAWEDFARVRPWQRPRRYSRGNVERYRGFPRMGLAVVGWTQEALARACSGPATTDAGADPIDVKTVQRHAALAHEHGAVQIVTRNPEAEPQLRGLPSESNPRGWPINEYWLPAPHFHKPGFVGAWFDKDGNPLELDASLAIELTPRCKRPRRLRESAQAPPPIA